MALEENNPQSISRLNRLNQLCDRFERAWREGSSPRIEDYLVEVAEAERAELLRELLSLEIHYRRQRREQPAMDEYRSRFPQLDRAALEAELASAPSPRPADPLAVTVQGTPSGGIAPPGPGVRVRYLGDYELLEEVARGGMGVVYKARQISLNRIVAVKMILAGQLATPADRDRFQSEAEAAAHLDHPNIVPVFEVGEYEGHHYFSMGYVDGTSLSARLTDGPLPPKEAAKIMATVAEAVEYAHRQGVIHRDIKPSNILIDCQGSPRITDFGLAKRVDSGSNLTATGDRLGTPSYMAPEQAAGRIGAVGPAVDVYGLGALLYASLTGRPPFQAATPYETMQQVIEKEPVPLRQLNAAVPHDLETIVLKCLEKSVPRRYSTVRALAEDLRRYLEGRPILARPVGRLGHAWRWCKRQPVVAGLIAAVATTLLAGIVVSSLFAVDAYRQAELARENAIKWRIAEEAARNALAGALLEQARWAIASGPSREYFGSIHPVPKEFFEALPSFDEDEALAALRLAEMVVAKQLPGLHDGLGHVAFSPRMDTYAHCGADRRLSVRRVADNAEIAAFQLDRDLDAWDGLEFSLDGRYLRATTGSDLSIMRGKSWLFRVDVEPGAIILAGKPLALAFSPDSREFVARYPSGELALRDPSSISESADSRQHVSDVISICELASGKELKRFAVPAHPDDLRFMFWNPRKPKIVLFRRAGCRLLDIDTGALGPESVDFSHMWSLDDKSGPLSPCELKVGDSAKDHKMLPPMAEEGSSK
jgi:tRNA A-37 threonylcarbamoyl transferase component Bud32